jgi:hypothetical protein
MSNLFTDESDVDTELDTPIEMASPKQVRLLEGHNYRKEAVRKWTKEKAETVLRKCQQEERIALNRANAKAKEQDAGAPRGQVSPLERAVAAAALEEAVADNADETLIVMSAALYVLTDDETKRLAGYLIRMWRAPDAAAGTAGGTGRAGVRGDGDGRQAECDAPEGG